VLSLKRNSTERLADPSKRRLFKGRVKVEQVLPLPWSVNDNAFTQGCTQCSECISACETNIIVKDDQGFPKVDFTLGECTFCDKCIDACEQPLFTGSFTERNSLNSLVEAHSRAWPATLNISDKCLAKNNIYCQSCRDECEPNAIKFIYLESSIPQPKINETDCSQCGACISTCPQDALAFNFIERI
jgi:ferredoxin-type protein NapF